MTELFSVNNNNTAVLIMDYQNRQVGNFSDGFQKEILGKAN